MKIFFYVCVIFFNCLLLQANDNVKITGNTNYEQKNTKNLITTINLEYKIELYKHPNNIYVINLGGKISNDYDHFRNEFKNNVFTTIGIDF